MNDTDRTAGQRWQRRAGLAGLALLPLLGACDGVPTSDAVREPTPTIGPVSVGEEIAGYYRERQYKPLWFAGRKVKPEALALLQRIEGAALHGLDPSRYQPERLRRAVEAAAGREPQAVAQAELLISKAFSDFARDLRRPPERAKMLYVDEELRPSVPSARSLLDSLAEAPAFATRLELELGVNPLYDRLAKGFAGYFDRWSGLPQIQLPAVELRPGMQGGAVGALRRRLGLKQGDRYDAELARAVRRFEAAHALDADGIADPATIAALNRGYRHYERIIQANLDRARALPASGERFVLVDTAGARLWLFDRGEAVDTMRVIVGKEAMATPEMAALIRFAALNPVWNVPPDLIRTSVARQVLKQGVGYLSRQRLQVLSDWSPGARVLNPAQVDWRAVAAGGRLVQVRQLPGPGNVMGKVKFMFPNKLGIYLHDTPDKNAFTAGQRRISSGCVRLEDADRLGRWLFKGEMPAPSGAAEQRADLPEPVPVYITYLTAVPGPGGISFQPDVYGRDAKLAQLSTR